MYPEEQPKCNYCQMMDKLMASRQDATVRVYRGPDGPMVAVWVDDRFIDAFDELTLGCLCGRR